MTSELWEFHLNRYSSESSMVLILHKVPYKQANDNVLVSNKEEKQSVEQLKCSKNWPHRCWVTGKRVYYYGSFYYSSSSSAECSAQVSSRWPDLGWPREKGRRARSKNECALFSSELRLPTPAACVLSCYYFGSQAFVHCVHSGLFLGRQ